MDYVGRYTHRIAISNNRLLSIDDGKVRFRWRDYRNRNRRGTMTLTAEKFIRRFLLHVLPEGFQRIRYYGFLGNRYREQNLRRCRELLGIATETPPAVGRSNDYRDHYEAVVGICLKECPVCHHGHMILVEVIPKPSTHRRARARAGPPHQAAQVNPAAGSGDLILIQLSETLRMA